MTIDRRTELANSIVIGSDGWLFHKDNLAFEQMSGEKPFSHHDLDRWARLLELRYLWLKAHGAGYVFFVAPEKHVVYAEKLPPEWIISEERPVLQLARHLDEGKYLGPGLVYPISALTLRKSELETFWSVGSHWNYFGAYWGYLDLCEAIGRQVALPRVLTPEDFQLSPYRHAGDLGVRLEPEPVEDEQVAGLTNPQALKVFHNRAYSRGAVAVFEQPNKDLPRAVMFRDSATSWLVPFLAESFSRLVLVSSTEVYFDLVEAEQPDIVVTEMIERFLNEPGEAPNDLDCRSFEDLCGCPIGTITAATLEHPDLAAQKVQNV